ncbi:MAG: BREX-1 system adenine-specific DNA-methyltransferase PglX, partial [Fusobacteriaceae bacterium]
YDFETYNSSIGINIETNSNEFGKKIRTTTNQKDFEKIPGSPIAYWVSERVRDIFESTKKIAIISKPKSGIMTGNDEVFLRLWHETEEKKSCYNPKSSEDILISQKKWFPLSKGGLFRKWFGNLEHTINLENMGLDIIKSSGNHRLRDSKYYFQNSISWSRISSGKIAFRNQHKVLFSDAGPSIFPLETDNYYITSFLNSNIALKMIGLINPTLNYQVSDIGSLPLIFPKLEAEKNIINQITQNCIEISKTEWDSRETSWDFEGLELVQGDSLESSYLKYCESWKEKFFTMHKNEEELNRMFIEIYGLEDEMDEKVELKDITLLKKEANIVDGELVFNREELTKQFLSYAVGCIMG